jgi:hypothetical protein
VIDFLIVWLPLPPWNDLIGGITVALSIRVIAFPFFGLLTVYCLMASILIINGAAYIIAGITGAVYVPIGLGLARGGSRSFWESDATQVSNYLPYKYRSRTRYSYHMSGQPERQLWIRRIVE